MGTVNLIDELFQSIIISNRYYLPGIKSLREAIAKFHEKTDDIHGISPEDIIVGPGTKQLSFLFLTVFNGGMKYFRFANLQVF